ncbi:helix-turn-helix domain-containing protein [Paracoccus sp. IB05]|uniref:helix-turn-helix domain-containing protein n=1 Tax=Paracoccus sp. IB05 TaxID=2779367 RepID=UPI0018E7F947|nr:helix-turn-helix domain-containing protein [Paracoccus sp. IB05]MBJ2153960.1 helix-turn-helix domain-containing protein [Paracoccus sp. IB05]
MSVDLQRHELIKFRLRSGGSSFAQVAKSEGVLPSSVTVVSQGYRRSHRIQAAIARVIGTTPQELFPERYPVKEDDVPM